MSTKKRSHLLSSTKEFNTIPSKYTNNSASVNLQNDGTSDFQFKVQAFFTGPILYNASTVDAVALYGGNAWGRNSGGHSWDQSMWPGQFARQTKTNGKQPGQDGIGAGQYLVSNNPSCGDITHTQPLCKYTPTNAITTNPNLAPKSKSNPNGGNTCCAPYYDLSNIKAGKELIFNSYYGFCFSGYAWNWDFCTNKQVWISAVPDYINTTKLGDKGYADPLDVANGNKTMLQQSTNTKDITFFSGSGNQGGNAGDWCVPGQPNCPVPSNNNPKYVNPPQIPSSTFPKVINTSTINWTVPGLGVTADAPNGCPTNCPVPNGFIRWGEKLISGNTPPSGPDKPNDWTVALPSDGYENMVWMPSSNQRRISYYPLISAPTSDNPNKLQPILGVNYDFTSLTGNNPITNTSQLATWMGSIAHSTELSMSSRQYVAYGCLIHGAACAIYNDWYSNDPASGLTIFNSPSDFIKLYTLNPVVSSTGIQTSLKSQLIKSASSTASSTSVLDGSTIWKNVFGNAIDTSTRQPIPNPSLIANLIPAPTIKKYKKDANGIQQYQITFSQSIWQFLASSVNTSVVSLFQKDTPENYASLMSILNAYIQDQARLYFGSNDGNLSGEYLFYAGTKTQTPNLQQLQLALSSDVTSMKNIPMSFNCWDMVNGVQQSSPISAYNFINPNGTLKGSAFDYKNSNNYHAISINYTAVIKQFSPMAVLYYSVTNGGTSGPNLEVTDPMCAIKTSNTGIAPSISCMNAFVNTSPKRSRLLGACAGGASGTKGGFRYQPPIKKITQPSQTPSENIPAVLIQDTNRGSGNIANYLFSLNTNQSNLPECACINTRLNDYQNNANIEGGMCFSTTCAANTTISETILGLTKGVCTSHCETMCNLLQGNKIRNTKDFDSLRYLQVCGKPCSNIDFTWIGFNEDVFYSSFILVPLLILTSWLTDAAPVSNGKIIKTIFISIGIIGVFYALGRFLNGHFECNQIGSEQKVDSGACYLNWPFGEKPPKWYNIKIPNSLCKNWWEVSCQCLGTCDSSTATCPGCGTDCDCVDGKCRNPDPSKRKNVTKTRSKFNLVYLVAAILFSLCSVLIFNKLSKFSGITNDIISGLIILAPLVIWYILFNGKISYTIEESTCS